MRKIIHVDADSFFASVEMRDNPELKNHPVAVGGQPGKRGVVATCNYKAREFGIHSAMASSLAIRKCPQLIFVKPRFEAYRAASEQIHKIFHDYTDIIEPLSLDEAYLDVSDTQVCQGSATLIADEIRQRIKQEVGVTVSAGIAPNKFLAKVASDWNKPDGIFLLAPKDIEHFVKNLPVKKINGVGKVTTEKLAQRGIFICGDLQRYSLIELTKMMGSFGERLYSMCRGIDDREVKIDRIRKSISVETTYIEDMDDLKKIELEVKKLILELEQRFEKHKNNYYPVSRYIKLKTFDFKSTSAEEVIMSFSENGFKEDAFLKLVTKAWARHNKAIRLIGVGLKLKTLDQVEETPQFSLF